MGGSGIVGMGSPGQCSGAHDGSKGEGGLQGGGVEGVRGMGPDGDGDGRGDHGDGRGGISL